MYSAIRDGPVMVAARFGARHTRAAIAGGGIVGGVLLDRLGVGAFPPALLALLIATLIVVWTARLRGFPAVQG